MDDEAIAVAALAVVYETVGTLKSVRMLFACVLDVGLHHFATLVSHAAISHAAIVSAMGGNLP